MNTLHVFTYYKFADVEHVLIHPSFSNISIFMKKGLPEELFSPSIQTFLRSNISLEETNQNWGRLIVVGGIQMT